MTQEVGQPHLGVTDVFADFHPVGDSDATSGLTHVERHRGTRHGQEGHGEEHSHLGNPARWRDAAFQETLLSSNGCGDAAAGLYIQQGEPAPSAWESVINYLSKTQRRRVWRQRLVLG